MKKIIFTILTLNLFLFNSYSQIDMEVLKTIEEWKGETKKHQFEENVLIDISGNKIDFEEFKSIFYKNNPKDSIYDEAYILDYFSLFVKFKLKIQEAKELGYDTVSSFIDEFEGYKKQLSSPYLSDSSVQNMLINEAYERMKYEVNVSHILIKLDADALPRDTLIAYRKALSIKRKISNDNFDDIAYNFSDDPSSKQNYGSLGYFSVFRMVYPFESAAYNTPVGEVSKPIRSQFGYHLVRVNDKRESLGEVKVAHILIRSSEDDSDIEQKSAEDRINQLLELINQGQNFTDLVQYSEDRGSASKKGELPWFSSGRMVPEFEKVAFGLNEVGQISKPFKTIYGWHIIKLINKRGVPSFKDAKKDIESKVKRDSRSSFNNQIVINNIKKEYSFREYIYNLKIFYNKEISKEWSSELFKNNKKTIFKLGDKKYTQYDFAKYIEKNNLLTSKEKSEKFIFSTFQSYVNEMCIDYEVSQLPEKYPDYKMLLKEYKEGILLFNISNDKIWSKANRDTLGLRLFYERNLSSYRVDTLIDCFIFSSINGVDLLRLKENIIGVENSKTLFEFSKFTDLNFIDKKERYIPKGLSFNNDNYISSMSQNIELLDFLKSDYITNYKKYFQSNYSLIKMNTYRDNLADFKSSYKEISYKKVISDISNFDGEFFFVYINSFKYNYQFDLNEIKGRVISDYQDYLEDNWLNDLMSNYDINVNLDLLKTLVSK